MDAAVDIRDRKTSRALRSVGSLESRGRIGEYWNEYESKEDGNTERYRIAGRFASRVAAVLDHRSQHQTLNGGAYRSISKFFKAFQQSNLLSIRVEHQLLRNVISRIVVELVSALDQRLIDIKQISLEGGSQFGIPGSLTLLDGFAELIDLFFELL